MSQVRAGAKQTTDVFTALFLSQCFSKPMLFAKTGSGQTNETKITHLKNGGVCLFIAAHVGKSCRRAGVPDQKRFLKAIYIQIRAFCQDRLGTNIGKALTKKTVPSQVPHQAGAAKSLDETGENTVFLSH